MKNVLQGHTVFLEKELQIGNYSGMIIIVINLAAKIMVWDLASSLTL